MNGCLGNFELPNKNVDNVFFEKKVKRSYFDDFILPFKYLYSLYLFCCEFTLAVGPEADSSYIEAGGVLLFEVFKESEKVHSSETTRLRGIFGPFPASAATKACQIVNKIVSWLPEAVVQSVGQTSTSQFQSDTTKEFGDGIKFSTATETSEDLTDWLDASSDEEASLEEKFDMRYTSEEMNRGAGRETIDAAWLKHQVDAQFSSDPAALGMSVMDMCTTVFDLLCSSKPDSALQNDVSIHYTKLVYILHKTVEFITNGCKTRHKANLSHPRWYLE